MKPSDAQAKETASSATNAGLIGITAFGGAIVGFFLQLLVAYYFGASSQTDAFFMAHSTSELLTKLLLGGSITSVFIPVFIELLTKDNRHDAWAVALNVFHLTSFVFIIVIFSLALYAEPFINFIAPGFDSDTKALTISLLRVLLPSFLFLFLAELATSMLHSLQRFAIPAFLRVIAPTISIISILLFVNRLGIYALAIGTILGSIIQFSFLWWALRKEGLSYRFVFQPAHPVIKKILFLVYPFILSVLVTQGAGITYRVLVSDLSTGSLAALKFSEKITQLLTIIFLNSITLVIYPLLSRKAAKRDYHGMVETISSSLRLITFITVPVIIGVILLREPLISFLFERGSFTSRDAAMTSVALLWMIIGLTTNGISSVFGHTVLALQKTRASVAVSISSQAVAISLFVLLVPRLQHAGLALASSLVPLSSGLLYFLYLNSYLPKLHRVFLHTTFLKTAALSLILAIVVYLTLPIVTAFPLPHQLSLFLTILIPTLLGAASYFLGAKLLKVPELQTLTQIITSKRNKWSSPPSPRGS